MIENAMISTSEARYHFEKTYIVKNLCGCGSVAKYLVYNHEEPHCHMCFMEAIDGQTVKVRGL